MVQLKPVPVKLNQSIFKSRMELNGKYMMSLDAKRLLANYFLEAGLNSNIHLDSFPKHYGGWEEPDMQVRGSFAGHFMSACAFLFYFENDSEMKSKGDAMVDYLELCQNENEDNWVGSIPPVYLDRIARNKWVWAPQYMVHKTFMGLVDMYKYASNKKALDIAEKWSDWFYNWTNKFNAEQLSKLADWESGGLMEIWAELYGITKNEKYKILMERYYRSNLFDPLINGEDILSFKHANTSIPEAYGCARAYEVTGDVKYRKAVEQFWHFAVETRFRFVTGGQNNYELWVNDLASSLSRLNQEFCTVYNMNRLADYLLRWTGESKYADYIELNYYNGVLAQQNKNTGEVCYFLPMEGGSNKKWDDAYNNFYCCYGTMVQAQSSYGDKILYNSGDSFYVSQYIPFMTSVKVVNETVSLSMRFQNEVKNNAINNINFCISVSSESPCEFSLNLRIPVWFNSFKITVNGKTEEAENKQGWCVIKRVWKGECNIVITPSIKMDVIPLGKNDDRFAFRYGPIVMAGLADGEYTLKGKAEEIASLINTGSISFADNTNRSYAFLKKQHVNFKLIPLYDVADERYTVYFPFSD